MLESLPAEERATPAALRVRLNYCPALSAWDIGEHVAKLLIDGGEEDRESVARFRQSVALFHAKAGNMEAARDSIKAAIDAWPKIRLALIDDKDLDGVIFP